MFESIKIKVSNDLVETCKKYLSKNSLGNRGIEDGDFQQQLTGLIGEILVYYYINGEYPNLDEKFNGFDGGVDIVHKGKKIDVKTMGRNSYVKGNYVNNFYVMQQNYDSEILVFCSYHKSENVLEICGWINKADLGKKGIFYKAGTKRVRENGTFFIFRQDNYEVENKDLDHIDQLKSI